MPRLPLALALLVLVGAAAAAAPTTPSNEKAEKADDAAVKRFADGHTGAAAGSTSTATGKSAGSERKLGGLDAYVVGPADAKAAVLVVPDVYGWKTQQIRGWADKLAAAGFLAVVPDYFKGDDRKKSDSADTFAAWLQRYPRERVLSESDAVLADIKKAFPSVKKIGVQGFCWGGLYSVLLAGQPAVDAAGVFHGSLLKASDVAAVKVPIKFLQSDPTLDGQIGPELYKQIDGVLAAKRASGLDASIKSFPKQGHGFSLRGDASDPAVARAANAAFDEGLAFLNKHLK